MSDTLRLRSDRLQWLETEGEVVALDESSLLYLGLNESGSLLWSELATGATREALVAKLVEAFGVEAETATADVDRFVAELDRRDLLTR